MREPNLHSNNGYTEFTFLWELEFTYGVGRVGRGPTRPRTRKDPGLSAGVRPLGARAGYRVVSRYTVTRTYSGRVLLGTHWTATRTPAGFSPWSAIAAATMVLHRWA